MKKLLFFIAILGCTSGVSSQVRTDFDRKMNEPVKPFKIIDNIYYVGASDVTVFLITTDSGHIMIDGGFRETVPQIEANVKALGFDLKDVKILLNNHAHYDHAGGLSLLKGKTGAKLYASKNQKRQLENGGREDFAFGNLLAFDPVLVDERIKDQDQITLGERTLVAHFTPGHTKGCTSFTTQATNGDATYDVMFLCSTTALSYDLIKNKKYRSIADDFRFTFSRLRSMNVDIFLASHASFFGMSKKLETLQQNPVLNPFIDATGYSRFISVTQKAFEDKFAFQMSASGNY